jgi:hypothetical protein
MARNDHQKCQSSVEQGRRSEPVEALVHGILMQCIQQQKLSKVPDTLAYDRLRIRQLQEDVQDIIYLDLCAQVFNKFLRRRFGNKTVSPKTYATLHWRITTIIENDDSEARSESWQALTEDVAVEITRAAYVDYGLEHCSIPDGDFECTTRDLRSAFSDNFGLLAHGLHAKLEQMTLAHAAIFQERSPLQISEAQKLWQQSRHDKKFWRADVEDVARRVAHMAVLHWKIWAGLVYLEEEEDSVVGKPMRHDENGTGGLHQIPVESRNPVAMEPEWTPPADQTSMVDERGEDSV